MKNSGRVFIALILTFGANSVLSGRSSPVMSLEAKERFLRTAPIAAARSTEEGITHTSRLTLGDGAFTHDAHLQQIDVYKPIYRTKDYTEKNFRDSYKYNIAAYRVAKMLGLDNTPPCVYRVVDGKGGSVCWWVDNVQMDEKSRRDKGLEPPDPNFWTQQLNEIRVFDQLIDNTDRTQENLLIDKDWKLWMIDHSRAFRVTYQLRKPENLRRISQSLLTAIRSMSELRLAAATEPYLTPAEIHAVMVRRDLLIKFFDKEITDKGAEVVFTDLPRKTPVVTIP